MFRTDASHCPTRSAFCLAVAFCLGMVWAGRSHGQDESQPFMVYVDQEGVAARCGPGGDYYRTDPLRHGQSLEVYIETSDGWLGVRPPEGSFCWIPEDVVKLSPSQDFGIITEEDTIVWIGTHLGKANRYLWQVQLSKEEEVAIIGRAKREGPDGPKLWFRIVPPAGEFRWVHRDQVVDNPEMLLREKPAADSRLASGQPTLAPTPVDFEASKAGSQPMEQSVLQATVSPRLPVPPADGEDDRRSAAASNLALVIGSGLQQVRSQTVSADGRGSQFPGSQQAGGPIDASPVNDTAFHDRSGRPYESAVAAGNAMEIARAYEAPLIAFTGQTQVRPIGSRLDTPAPQAIADAFNSRLGSATSSTADQTADTRTAITSSVVTASNQVPIAAPELRTIDGLQLELSRLMARSATASDLNGVLEAATIQASSSADQTERQRASMIVKRAQQYQEVARRRDGDHTAPPHYPQPIHPMAIPGSDDEATREAAGHLVQVFSSRPDSPPYALTDSQGRTTHYVSAAPGVNLRRYLNQHVTVRGASGYSTGLDTPHVIASGAVRTPER